MERIVWFIVVLGAVYLFYYLFIVRKYDIHGNRNIKRAKKKQKIDVARYPSEVELFIYKYKIDLKKINFRTMLKAIGFVCSIDIAIIITIISFINTKNIYIQLGIGALLVIPIILISFSILGKIYKKKGLTKHV